MYVCMYIYIYIYIQISLGEACETLVLFMFDRLNAGLTVVQPRSVLLVCQQLIRDSSAAT